MNKDFEEYKKNYIYTKELEYNKMIDDAYNNFKNNSSDYKKIMKKFEDNPFSKKAINEEKRFEDYYLELVKKKYSFSDYIKVSDDKLKIDFSKEYWESNKILYSDNINLKDKVNLSIIDKFKKAISYSKKDKKYIILSFTKKTFASLNNSPTGVFSNYCFREPYTLIELNLASIEGDINNYLAYTNFFYDNLSFEITKLLNADFLILKNFPIMPTSKNDFNIHKINNAMSNLFDLIKLRCSNSKITIFNFLLNKNEKKEEKLSNVLYDCIDNNEEYSILLNNSYRLLFSD